MGWSAHPTYKGAEAALITTDTIRGVFTASPLTAGARAPKVIVEEDVDPWRGHARGSTSCSWALTPASDAPVRGPDSMIVASIDTRTGRTVLISVPRNFEWAPLPATSPLRTMWPDGFYGGTHDQPNCPRKAIDPNDPCAINAIWTEVDQYRAAHPEAWPGDPVPGRSETRDVVGEVLGLKIDHLVVIDLKGFTELVDAMGGLTVNVKLGGFDGKTPCPTVPSTRTAPTPTTSTSSAPSGSTATRRCWYARTRAADSDDHRQQRQRCVVQAVVDQVDPAMMLTKYASIAKILQENVYTDIPGQNLPAFAELVDRVQKASISSLSFSAKNGLPFGSNPDYELVRKLVMKAITPPKPKPAAPSTATPADKPTPEPTRTPKPASTTSPAEVDECA